MSYKRASYELIICEVHSTNVEVTLFEPESVCFIVEQDYDLVEHVEQTYFQRVNHSAAILFMPQA